MTRLLSIDTATGRVRVYKRGPYGGLKKMDEADIVRPQTEDLPEQLESLRAGRPIQYASQEPAHA